MFTVHYRKSWSVKLQKWPVITRHWLLFTSLILLIFLISNWKVLWIQLCLFVHLCAHLSVTPNFLLKVVLLFFGFFYMNSGFSNCIKVIEPIFGKVGYTRAQNLFIRFFWKYRWWLALKVGKSDCFGFSRKILILPYIIFLLL